MKTVKRAYKYRFHPAKKQIRLLAQTFGRVRFVYNRGLEQRKKSYGETGKGIGYNETSARLTMLKSQKRWLREVSSVPLQQCLRHLDRAYINFFKKISRYPRFKNRNARQAAHYTKAGFSLQGDTINIGRLGEITPVWSRRFAGEPTSLTISKDGDGRYFVSVLVEERVGELPFSRNMIGLDMGIKDVVAGSDGLKSGNPQFTYKYEKKPGREQRILSRKKKGSSNRQRQRLKVAKLHSKIRNSRNDFLHKLSTDMVRKNQVVCIEDLNTKGMVRNRKLSKSICDSSWGTLVDFLEYKCRLYGRELRRVSPYYTSRDCSDCGWRNRELKLEERYWRCRDCGRVHDRDVNAAKNILAAGTAVSACGDSVRPKVHVPEAVVREARISAL